MPDTFERELKFKFANESECWELMSNIQSRAERRLHEVTPNVTKPDIRIGAESGSTFGRDTLADGKDALQEHDETLDTIVLELAALSEPDHSWTWEAKVWALGIMKTQNLIVKVSGRSKVAVEGLASTLAAATPEPDGVASPRDTHTHGAVPNTSTPQQLPSSDSWLKRTWRDHAATFVIAVVAGVAVIAIALALGLSHV